MTRNRVPYLGIAAIAAATLLSPNAYSQSAGQATLIGAAAGSQTCSYASIAMQPNGQIDVTCTASSTTVVGKLAFSSPGYTLAKAVSTTGSLSVIVSRVIGNSGAIDAILNVGAPCTMSQSSTIHFATGTSGSLTYQITSGPGTAHTCSLDIVSANPLEAAQGAGAVVSSSISVSDQPASGGGGGGITPPAGCPAVGANVVMETMLGRSVNQYLVDTPRTDTLPPTIHVYPLPKGASGLQINTGNFAFTTNTSMTPTSLRVDVGLSKCPGDIAFWRTPAGAVNMYGTTWHPCGSDGTGEQAGVKWTTAPNSTFYECSIPAGENWYLNVRYTDSSGVYTCTGRSSCGQVFNWNGN